MSNFNDKQLIKGNLVIILLALIISFLVTRSYLESEDDLTPDELLPRIGKISKSIGITTFSLPYPLNDYSILIAPPFGAADTAYKINRFFTKNINISFTEKINNIGFRSESVIFGRLINENYISKDEKIKILHLCSANSCVGPYLTQYHVIQKEKDNVKSKSVYAMIYGEGVIGNIIQKDLKTLGVHTPQYSYRMGFESAAPLHGNIIEENFNKNKSISNKNNFIVDAKCFSMNNTCHYLLIKNDTNKPKSVTVFPFNKILFNGISMLNMEFNLVHIDVNSDETLSSITFLNGIVSTKLRPKHIIITLYPSLFIKELIYLVEILKQKESYNVFIMGGKCLDISNSSIISSFVSLLKLLQDESPDFFSRINMRFYAAEPLCVLFLSQIYFSLPNLFENVSPIEEINTVLNFLYGISKRDISNVEKFNNNNKSNDLGFINYLILLLPVVVVGLLLCGFARSLRR